MGRPRNSHRHHHVKQRSRPASVESDEDELHETGIHASPAISPPYSVVHPQSQSGSSSQPGEFHLSFPSELPEHEPEVYPYDSASRLDTRERPQAPRTNSSRRENPHHRRAQTAPRQRAPRPPSSTDSSTESGDSTEEFITGKPDYAAAMPRAGQSYHGQNGYTQSNSSGSYGYPTVPTSNQMVHYAPPPQHQPVHPHWQQNPHAPYPPMASPPPPGYPPPPGGYPQDPRMRHEHNHQGPHYRPSQYGPAQVVQYGPPPQGYFPPGYPAPHPYPPPQQYYPGGPSPYLPQFMHDWQVASHSRRASPPAEKKKEEEEKALVPAPPPPPPAPTGPTQEEIILKMQEILLSSNEEREKRERDRQAAIMSAEDQVAAIRKAEHERAMEEARIKAEAIRMARDQAEAAAKAQAERAKEEQRIREDAIRAAHKAIADKQAADAEQAAREARIREDAAREALAKAAAEAKAKADQEAKEKKIAADAAAEAKSAAEKKAADDAAAKEAAAKKAADDAAAALKDAEEKAAKATAEAEDKAAKATAAAEEKAAKATAEAEAANKAAAAAKPPDKKPPVRFKDAIGRNYNFPWERCNKWRDMENLIVQAFQHIEDLGEHVINGRYDLIGPDKDIIMPQYWDYIIQPDMHITMMLWPLPEKPPPPPEPEPALLLPGLPLDPLPPPIVDGLLDLDEFMNQGKKKKENKDKGKKPVGSSFANWMLGGAPRAPSRKPLKGHKKPDVAAV